MSSINTDSTQQSSVPISNGIASSTHKQLSSSISATSCDTDDGDSQYTPNHAKRVNSSKQNEQNEQIII